MAVTGVGGPEPVEGKPPGTVFIAVHSADDDRVEQYLFDGDIEDMVNATALHALKLVLQVVEGRLS